MCIVLGFGTWIIKRGSQFMLKYSNQCFYIPSSEQKSEGKNTILKTTDRINSDQSGSDQVGSTRIDSDRQKINKLRNIFFI